MIRKKLLTGVLALLCLVSVQIIKAQDVPPEYPEYSYCDTITRSVTASAVPISEARTYHTFSLLVPTWGFFIYGMQWTPEMHAYGYVTITRDGQLFTPFADGGYVNMLSDHATYGGEKGRQDIWLPAGNYKIETYVSASSTSAPELQDYAYAYLYLYAGGTPPNVYTVTGGGSACDGGNTSVTIGLDNSDMDVTYQLFRDNVPITTVHSAAGGPVSFGSFQTPGTYTVATTAPCAVINMNGSAVITDSRPANFSAWNDGPKCSPTPTINLSATPIPGATYYWSGPYGFTQTTSSNTTQILGLEGSFPYSVYAVVNGCATPTASTTVTVTPAPVPASAGPDQTICGLNTTLTGNSTGTWTQVSAPPGGNTQFGNAAASTTNVNVFVPGTYVYRWTTTYGASCTPSYDDVVVTYYDIPTSYAVTGGGSRCSNDTGLSINLSGSQPGITYQLLFNGSGAGIAPVAGTGGPLTWSNRMDGGVYTVQAIRAPGCTVLMNNSVSINVNTAPNQYAVGGTNTVCEGTPVAVTLSGSESVVSYQLYRNGTSSGSAVTGTGGSLTWPVLQSGTYTIIGTRGTCTRSMSDNAIITINPVPTAFPLGGGGIECYGGAGFTISQAGSQTGVSYQLKVDGVNAGLPVAGTGSGLSWLNQTTGGVYTVVATHGTGGCTQTMTNSRTITINPLPTVYTVGGGATFCTPTQFTITLSDSEAGVNYLLKRGTTTISTLAGTGNALSWPSQITPGDYTITATNTTTSCTQTMGTATVTLNTQPSLYTLSGGGSRCENGPALSINMNGSQSTAMYQLKRDGVNIGNAVQGTGSAMSWTSLTEAGTYTVEATLNGCTRVMSSPRTITIKPAPTTADAGPDLNVCGLEINLAGNTPIVGTGTWTQISGPEQSNIDNINDPGTFVSVGQPDTYLYSWTINNNGCISSDIVQITYNMVATAADAGPDQEICDGSLVTAMSANAPVVGNGEWTLVSGPEGGVLYPDAYTPDAILFAPGQGVYVYRWTIANEPCTPSIDDVQISFGITALSFTVLQVQNSGERRFFIEEAETDLNWRNQYTYQWLYTNSNGVQTEVTHPAMPWSTSLFVFPDFLSGNVTNASLVVEVHTSSGCIARRVYGADVNGGNLRIEQLPANGAVSESEMNDDVQVYPVPASHTLTVGLPLGGPWKLELRNLNGALMNSGISHERKAVLDVSQIPAGLYFLYLQGHNKRTVMKVEVVR